MIIRTGIKLFIFVFGICGIAWAQTKSHRTTTQEFYPDGKVMRVIKTKTTTNLNIDLYNYYKRTLTRTTEFYPNGKVKSFQKKIRKLGTSGKPCYEVLDLLKEFSETGTLKFKKIIKCDKGSFVTKEYDSSGRVIFTRINIRR